MEKKHRKPYHSDQDRKGYLLLFSYYVVICIIHPFRQDLVTAFLDNGILTAVTVCIDVDVMIMMMDICVGNPLIHSAKGQ